ncbi:hypothetical protein DMN91_003573 [Ooceraea biroi]|uniref:Glucosylceramidase n=1 Tax=Ooceraea biroi TaxID=2015173 RepID=A0A026W6F6_OOCBI|nr:glucosylceramidase [Ooceraea biroi]EZA51682.1 Glucosylceramidase [Ooceraea biroi]RLU23369.1 hypothetical protein DMN91_003573 [Ooceraea biroi]
MWRAIVLAVLAAVSVNVESTGCIKRQSESRGDDDGHYCVCNATYCDEAPDAVKPPDPTGYVLITSCKSGLRFHVSSGNYDEIDFYADLVAAQNKNQEVLSDFFGIFSPFRSECSEKPSYPLTPGVITVNQTDVYQEIFGFGGAVTDAAGINILSLTKEASDNLLRNYFGPNGIEYSFIRTPMAGSDFSTRHYSYAMVENDTSLDNFTLQMEDYVYKIPVIKRAIELKGSEIKLLTAPWSASSWMKTNNNWTNGGTLDPRYQQVWANYFVKYFEAYRQANLEFWGLTPQNEPLNHLYAPERFSGMAWTAEQERNWVIEYLSPTLKKNFGHIKIFSADENRLAFPNWARTAFGNERARNIYSGTAIHFYFDTTFGPTVLDEIYQQFPEKSLIYTEACNGVQLAQRVILGSWGRGEIYAKNIIENMSHWVSTWIDWNIALDTSGGPNWAKNNVDSPIIVNKTANEFYKQPMFYVLGHFSKYVPPKSVRIGTTSENTEGIENVAFSRPDGSIALVLLNRNEEPKEIVIKDPMKGVTTINVPGKSINTMIY